ncbi:MAG: hypothetical protein JXX28_01940 [Deltaproteobacteria bacterium]|nr:hypothetical protein [Deltaproteobacteria bacterium]
MTRALLFALTLTPSLSQVAVASGAAEEAACMTCHKERNPGLYTQWYHSEHGKHGVTCFDCHSADKGDADAWMHEGALIATLVTPKDCGACHEQQANEVHASYHAHAGEILQSADAYLAHAVGGDPAAVAGCESCHGVTMLIDLTQENHLSRETWPNQGIGRINPDGSKGSCTACHPRHSFDKAQARQPEACGKCHLGPDHPQMEIYQESKHGNAYYTNRDLMNLRSDRWIVGQDYAAAPTCATCHMSATGTQGVTHDVGARISWTLRPPISTHKEGWEAKRDNMQDVCSACHQETFVDGHYRQFDGAVNLYNEKFAVPATAIMDKVKARGVMEGQAAFSNDIEWVYWEIWHHEGRRARHGAAMMGPDYTWWHGFYEVGHHFYFEFLPMAEAYGDPEINAMIEELKGEDMHSWMNRPTGDIKADIRSGELQKTYSHMFGAE